MKLKLDFIKRVFEFEMPLLGLPISFLYDYKSCILLNKTGIATFLSTI